MCGLVLWVFLMIFSIKKVSFLLYFFFFFCRDTKNIHLLVKKLLIFETSNKAIVSFEVFSLY